MNMVFVEHIYQTEQNTAKISWVLHPFLKFSNILTPVGLIDKQMNGTLLNFMSAERQSSF